MSTHTGLGACPGTATGPVARLGRPPVLPDSAPEPGPDERERALGALEAVAVELARRADLAEDGDVLVAAALMARDPGLGAKVAELVGQGMPAAWAVDRAVAGYRDLLADSHLAARAADLDDVRDRAVAHLLGLPMPGLPEPGHPYVLVAADLAPADAASLDPAVVLGLVTERGGPTSHTAILARSLGIPAVVACPAAASLVDGQRVRVDGTRGVVVEDPVDEAIASPVLGGPGRTADGHRIALLANIGGPTDIGDVEGVGLFRTEFLFLGRKNPPTVEEQRTAYRAVFEPLSGKRVVVRTVDAGSDKPVPFVADEPEPNPALGVRGLRTARRHLGHLHDQLDAIVLAAADTGVELWVMAPMVATAAEAADFAVVARERGIAQVGVMIEIPAAALRAADIASEVDFVSIGTNDLAQFTFAADRELGSLADLLDPWQPALLDLVARTARAARAAGKPVGVCGEAAADPLLAPVLVGLGVDSLSMAPVGAPHVRAALAEHTLDQCREIASAVLAAGSPRGARAAARSVRSVS
ncbi:PEP-utilizing enzyme [Actinokineospora auranticolor]|uniref:Phosphoenolpyruvate-protein phosphotransferase n=1 Tax=Actinokineospora auranticolor TaxID=155976 RepID=A0A2S6GW96_9PSEU|nr:putative PEP-binding protein [Actinokineospora auranticolor]PPK69450.1 phosphotransferase system enzyme I (PtsI) [Actinokineospora auranticolor]